LKLNFKNLKSLILLVTRSLLSILGKIKKLIKRYGITKQKT
jgi:hypothetical protein